MVQLAPRPESFHGKRLGLIDNGKHNGRELVEAVFTLLADELRPGEIIRCQVPTTRPADAELLDELARQCDFVIEAVGD
jgi:hypothetical protein